MSSHDLPRMSEEFADAIRNGDVKQIHALLDAGESVNCVYEHLVSPLLLAVGTGSAPAVRALLERGADPDRDSDLILGYAFKKQNIPVMRVLLNAGLRMHHFYQGTTYKEEVDKILASPQGMTMVKLLVDYGLNVDEFDAYGSTAMHRAAEQNEPKIIDDLARLGARVDGMDRLGRQPLHIAACFGSTRAFEALLRHGADIDARSSTGRTALTFAVFENQDEILTLLLDEHHHADGADLNHLLAKAARANADKVVRNLLERGADPYATDENGRTLLQITRSPEIKRLVRAARTANKLESAMQRDESAPSKPSSGGMAPL